MCGNQDLFSFICGPFYRQGQSGWIMTKQAKDERDTLHIGENIPI